MNHPGSGRSRNFFSAVTFILLLVLAGCQQPQDEPVTPQPSQTPVVLSKANPLVAAAIAVQNDHAIGLMKNDDVVGTAVGLTEEGKPAIIIYTARALGRAVIPESIEGVPVREFVSGRIVAFQTPSKGKPGAAAIDPKARFAAPRPIGISTGNVGECSAGTIGCRVVSRSNNEVVYALSNNHVFALENSAPLGSNIVQPGRYDVSCSNISTDVYATLSQFVPLSWTSSNTIDAAIALTTTANLGNATPSNGYGKPLSTTVAPAINMAVQKYGRTTGLTTSTITAINGNFNITYTGGTAYFTDQIVISGKKPFSKAGDSGSLIVTNPGRNPVGLLFAGSNTTTIANKIDNVLNTFGVDVDGR